ncbi:NAD(P)/FAD-dependent oxidoreductase [Martelella mediterranea]|uniref:Hydrogen cyanide synthase subunit HcnC n=1 Tax=Martelella mediterranea DSM 17316 TaxID=1122214 RepID=A0A1U9Z4J8_9HYPH|nr:FAD-dependent oxidoreductase [Martelella mediterranea]AQZ52594.1 Hydrogen cyanide synthase subunit HcnC precursor [Martelella mediterranea DSM 17316]
MDSEFIVIGGGIVGAALAYGIAGCGRKVLVLDGEDRDLRAARANFGLVWVQSKGANAPEYHRFSRKSADLWPDFVEQLSAETGAKIDYERNGGLMFCLGDEELETRAAAIRRMHNQHGDADTEMLDRVALERLLPAIKLGPEVSGASFSAADGHVNPLQLLAAMHEGVIRRGGKIRFRSKVRTIVPLDGGFRLETDDAGFTAARVVVAAGLATPALTAPLGLAIPMRSERGQILVLERMAPMLPYPASGLRQTAEGTIMIGATKEDTDDRGVSVSASVRLAGRATRIVPALGSARLVRQWSGFRVLPPDGSPIYAEATDLPGLYAAICHSGVTLAAAHARIVGPALAQGALPADLSAFSNGRFNVQDCA